MLKLELPEILPENLSSVLFSKFVSVCGEGFRSAQIFGVGPAHLGVGWDQSKFQAAP